MAPKRRVVDDEDEEVKHAEASPPATKRARTSVKGEGPSTQAHHAKPEDDDDENFDVGDAVTPPTQNIDDEDFEAQMQAKIRASIEKRHNHTAGIAEHGIIEFIEMSQFMCHKLLSFNFGPQINFIIGHNGSGKSAVLSAITVALGGKTASTGRGAGLKSFIREGQSVAEVTIMLKNQGDEAYKPQEYGKSIVITRRFTKDGNSSYKIKSKDGRVISTKKDELSAICDHMGIQVDNPLNVLTQDAARQFLSAANPQDKYKFFLKGTQLQQLSEEYELCLENIHQTSKILAAKKEALPDLQQHLTEVSAKFEEAKRARDQKKKIDELKKEKAWAHVKTKELELETKLEEVQRAERKLPKIIERLQEIEVEFEAAGQGIVECKQQLEAAGNVEPLEQERRAVHAKLREKKSEMDSIKDDIKGINTAMTAVTTQIRNFDKQIADEHKRMAADTQAKRQMILDQIEQVKAELDAAGERVDDLTNQANEARRQAEKAKARGMDLQGRQSQLQTEIQNCDVELDRAKRANHDQFVNYGRDIQRVVQEVERSQWYGERPIGPIGRYVKARDPRKWGILLSWQLRGVLDAFVVTDQRDRKQMQTILSRYGNDRTMIIITERDIFDYSNGEPPEGIMTVLRALEITDDFVVRVLINHSSIERMILTDTRREADQLLRTLHGPQRAWTLDNFAVSTFGGRGGGQSQPIKMRNPRMKLAGTSVADQTDAIQHQKTQLEAEYQALQQQIQQFQNEFNHARRAEETFKNQLRQASTARRQADGRLAGLRAQAEQEDQTSDIGALQAGKQAAEDEKSRLVEQFEDVKQQQETVEAELLELTVQQNTLRDEIERLSQGSQGVRLQMEALAEKRVKLGSDREHFEARRAEAQAHVDALKEVAEVLETEYKSWTAKALEYCPRVENPRKVADIERSIQAMSSALKERERRHGKSVEEMTVEVNKAQQKVNELKNDLKAMNRLNKQLKASLSQRLVKWQEFRRHIALRCKYVFQYHLSQRGYYGKVIFDHEQGTLSLKVQTDDQAIKKATGGNRDKDPRVLSGGEKSFSTICLLLSLWESIGCPLRCLDEFDVFMDAVNRRISMKMMIDTANTSDRKQYILITPQDMGNVSITDSVKVHRMSDPERRAVN
ncbi:P-loop containing nucleoside triphosphate hydrolase protein [Schizophyllum commune]